MEVGLGVEVCVFMFVFCVCACVNLCVRNTTQLNPIKYKVIQYNATQYNTTQSNTIQLYTTQHNTTESNTTIYSKTNRPNLVYPTCPVEQMGPASQYLSYLPYNGGLDLGEDNPTKLVNFHFLLSCFRRDSHKIDSFLKVLRCRAAKSRPESC